MGKKQAGAKKVSTATKPAAREATTRHARIELPDEDYERLRRTAKRIGLSVSAFIRMAVLERLDQYEAKGGTK